MDQPQFNFKPDPLSSSGLNLGLLAGYQWTAWNPSDVIGTETTAPGTGTADTTQWATPANSSGTVTVTFAKGGKYLVTIGGAMIHGNTFTFDRLSFTLGGTATRRTALTTAYSSGVPDQNSMSSLQFIVVATAGQTLTIRPALEVIGAGTVGQHTAHAFATVLYAGG